MLDAGVQQGSSPHLSDRVLKQPGAYRTCEAAWRVAGASVHVGGNCCATRHNCRSSRRKPQIGTKEETARTRRVTVQVLPPTPNKRSTNKFSMADGDRDLKQWAPPP
jgi:hypothetical protein